jgi:hypothetical protein
VVDGDWNVLLRFKYANERVSEETLADGETYSYEYKLKGAEVLQTTVTFPSGQRRQFFFEDGMLVGQELGRVRTPA